MLTENELKKLHGKQYVESFEKNQSQFRVERLVDSIRLEPKYRVVDFGCGNGMLLPFLANKVKMYTGVDFSEEFISLANRKKEQLSISNAEFICSDILKFCKENNNRYDVAFAFDFSEHIYDKDWLAILTAIKESLKPGGRLYMHTPNADFFLEKMKRHNFIVKQFPEHIAVRNPEENAVLLKKAGFKIKQMDLIPHYNTLKILHFFSFIPFLGKFFKARIFIEAIVPLCSDNKL